MLQCSQHYIFKVFQSSSSYETIGKETQINCHNEKLSKSTSKLWTNIQYITKGLIVDLKVALYIQWLPSWSGVLLVASGLCKSYTQKYKDELGKTKLFAYKSPKLHSKLISSQQNNRKIWTTWTLLYSFWEVRCSFAFYHKVSSLMKVPISTRVHYKSLRALRCNCTIFQQI